MRSCDDGINPPSLPPGLDLEIYSEATRRALYDIVVAVHFTAPAEVARGDWYPDYSPDEAPWRPPGGPAEPVGAHPRAGQSRRRTFA
jgi:hypothetical protein